MDAKEANRQQERELWLVLAGALMSGNKGIMADVAAALDTTDAIGDDLIGLLAAIKSGDRIAAWKCLERMGVERKEDASCVRGVIATLRTKAAKRACVLAAKSLTMSSVLDDPAKCVEYLEEQLQVLKSKL